MATASERLRFVIEGDSKSFVKSMGEAEKAADKSLGATEQKLDKLGAGLTKFGAGAMAFAGVAGAGLIKLGADASAAAIEAGKFSDATGLSVEAASRWIEVAGDMGIEASTVEKAIGFMNKTLGGSPEKFKELGVEVKRTADGAVDANGTFLAVVDRLNAIEDPAKRAEAGAKLLGRGWQEMAELIRAGSGPLTASLAQVSDAKVTSPEELAKAKEFRAAIDQMKDAAQDLAISLGQGVAPVIGSLAKVVGTVVDAFGKLDAVTSGAAGQFLGIGTAVLGAAGALSFVTGKVITGRDRFQQLFTTMSTDGVRSTNKLGTAMKGVGVAAGVAGAAFAVWSANAASDAQNMEAAAAAVENFSRAVTREDLEEEFLNWGAAITLAGKNVNNNFDDMARASLEGAKALRDSGLVAEHSAKSQKILEQAILDEEAARKQATATAEKYAETEEAAVEAVGDAQRGFENFTDALDTVQTALDDATTAAAENRQELADSQAAAQRARDEQNRLNEAHQRGIDMLRTYSAELDALTGNLDTEQAFLNLAQQIDDITASHKATADEIAAGTISAEEGMRRQALAVNSLKQDVIAYGQQLELTPDQITTLIKLIDNGEIEAMEQRLAILTRNRQMEVSIIAKGGDGYGPVNVPKFDDGGVMPGPRGKHSLALVAGGETVLPTHKTGAKAVGDTFVFNVTGSIDDKAARAFAEAARKYYRGLQ